MNGKERLSTRKTFTLPVSLRKPAAITTVAAPTVATGLLLTGLTTDAFANDLYSVRLEAAARVLRSDGRSDTVITAYVYDERGNVAPNGTRVLFSTTLGRLDTAVAITDNGVARVTLIAADQPGEAIIAANIEGGRAVQSTIRIRFTADAERSEEETNWMRLDGDYVGYMADASLRVIQINGKNGTAKFSYRSLTITADTIQYRVAENRLLAVGNVTVDTSGIKRGFSVLRYDFNSQEGVAERLDDGKPRTYELRGAALDETEYDAARFRPSTDTWQLEDLSGSSISVTARSILLERDRRLQFRRATFYLDGKKTISMPFHEMGLDQDSIFREQIIGLGPQGLSLDLPLYYDVRPNAVGTLHVRNSASVNGSVYGVRQGLSLDAVQEYTGPRATSGAVEAIGITRPDWGLRLRHGQRLDKATTANALVEFPNHRNLFINTSVRRNFNTFALNATAAASRNPGGTDPLTGIRSITNGDVRGQLFLDTYPRKFLKAKTITYATTVGASRQSFYGGVSTIGNVINTQNIASRLNTTPYAIAKNTTLSQSVSVGQTWLQGRRATGAGGTGAAGTTWEGITQVNHNLPRLGTVGLTYQYRQAPQLPGTDPSFANPRHFVSVSSYLGNTAATPGKGFSYQFQLQASRALDRPQSNLSSGIRFSFGGPWSGQVRFNRSTFRNFGYQEVEYAVVRRISGRDFAVYYSTLSRRFQLDLSGARF
jgi:hypothetical protein